MPARFAWSELASCAAREVKQPRRVYEGLVARRRMSRQTADREIAMMEAIAEHMRDQARGEDLFGPGGA